MRTVSAALFSLSVALVGGLASCAAPTYDIAPPRPSHPAVQRPAYDAPAVQKPVTPPPLVDQCGAADLQWLVGKPRTEIPIPVEITNRRVLCATCPRTEEHMPRRLTILYDQNSGIVQTVQCG